MTQFLSVHVHMTRCGLLMYPYLVSPSSLQPNPVLVWLVYDYVCT